jgi:hypothetical protein
MRSASRCVNGQDGQPNAGRAHVFAGGIPEEVGWTLRTPPGQPAPISATYEQMNLFGSPTGIRVSVACGHPLPGAPIGHEWAVVVELPEEG